MKKHFQSRRLIAAEKQAQAKKKVNFYSALRLITFIATGVFSWLWMQQGGMLWPLTVVMAAIGFLVLMRIQQKAQRQYRFYQNQVLVNQDEEMRLEFSYMKEDTGERFRDSQHPYSGDLDVFGTHSLYRLLNRTQTAQGSDRLADWLTHAAPLETILERQEALKLAKEDDAWRENWQATALLHKNATQQIGALADWINEPLPDDLVKGLRWKWWAVVTLSLIGAWAGGVIPFWPVLLSLGVHIVLLRKYGKYVQELTGRTLHIGTTLVAYSDLMALTREASFKGVWWDYQLSASKDAATAFRELGDWFSRLDFRANAYFSLFVGIPALWDLICLDALENWKRKHRAQFPQWMDALANIEAMNSLSGHAFAHPDQIVPEVHWGDDLAIDCTKVGHPLIANEKRICNDFTLSGLGQTILVTGSNMSGKSTFLRTVGVNLVLAQAGGVVAAERFSCSLMQVFTSMRTQDSLQENTSSFYAELKRLKQLLELAESPHRIPIFYLLDEILKGTNSADRHRGAAALITQLHPLRASGMVSTHDLELGVWGEEQPFVTNFHFSSEISSGSIKFDYTLKPGICSSFNASELMRMMGINLSHDGEN